MIGASGWLGGAIARKAIERGHRVTALARDVGKLAELEGLDVKGDCDATDPESLVPAIRDQTSWSQRHRPQLTRSEHDS